MSLGEIGAYLFLTILTLGSSFYLRVKDRAKTIEVPMKDEISLLWSPMNMLIKQIPALVEEDILCPAHPGNAYSHSCSMATMIMHLNDESNWTREQIADWLETLDLDLSFMSEEAHE